jgi:hypothetical protein
MAGGSGGDDEIDLDEFLLQSAEYETGGNAWDRRAQGDQHGLPAITPSTPCARRSCSAGWRPASTRRSSPATPRAATAPAAIRSATTSSTPPVTMAERCATHFATINDSLGRARDAFSQAFKGRNDDMV